MNCAGIENVSIGNSYGGVLYDLKINVNFNSPSTFEASFVSENGSYNIDSNSLNAETPVNLQIDKQIYKIYPVTFKITESASGKLLCVKYVDASHIYLDKYNITVSGVSGTRFLPILPIDDIGENIDLGSYTPRELYHSMARKRIPMTTGVKNKLLLFGKKRQGKMHTGIYLDTIGTLRDALNYIGTQLACTFYWDWTNTQNSPYGRLSVANPVDSVSAINFANQIKDASSAGYGKYISSCDTSCSIEDNYACADIIYDIEKKQIHTGQTSSMIHMKYYHMNIAGCTIKFGSKTLSRKILETVNWLKLCAVATAGEEIFKKYIMWNIAADFSKRPIAGGWEAYKNTGKTSHEFSPKKKNDLVRELFEDMIDEDQSGVLLYKEADETWGNLMRDYKSKGLHGQAGYIKRLKKFVDEDKLKATQFNTASSCVAIKLTKNLKLDSEIHKLHSICKTFGESYRRFFLYGRIISIEQDQEKGTPTAKRMKYEKYVKYNIQDANWIYEKQGVFQTELKDYASLILGEEEEEKDGRNPIFLDFFNGKFDSQSESIEDYSDENKMNLNGYIMIDKGKKEASIKSDIEMWKDPDEGEVKAGKTVVGISEVILLTADSNIEYQAENALRIFPLDDFSDVVSRTYRSDPIAGQELNPSYDMQLAGASQSQSHPFAVSNNVTFNKVPDDILDEDGNVILSFNKNKWLQTLKNNKWPDIKPTVTCSFTIEKLAPILRGWINRGMESYALTYNGSNGVTTSLVIGNRKKQRQSLECQERLVRSYSSIHVPISKLSMPRTSIARASTAYGMRAFS